MNRGGFSWSRFLGVSSFKARVSRRIGVPLTESGRERKVGRAVMRAGWIFWIIVLAAIAGMCAR